MVTELKRRRFTVDEYYQMAKAGILGEDDRVELIEGEIVEMSTIGVRHAYCVDQLNELFVRNFGDVARIRVQNPRSPGRLLGTRARLRPGPTASTVRTASSEGGRFRGSGSSWSSNPLTSARHVWRPNALYLLLAWDSLLIKRPQAGANPD